MLPVRKPLKIKGIRIILIVKIIHQFAPHVAQRKNTNNVVVSSLKARIYGLF